MIAKLPARGGFRARHPELADKRIVLFLSRLHWKKGLDVLASAMTRLVQTIPDAALVVAGPDDGALGDFQQQVRNLSLKDHVHIVGAVYGDAKSELLVDADVFCLPSRQEGFSMAILEALAATVPVVISQQCNFPEVGSESAGLVTQLSDVAVAEALIEVLSKPEMARQMGQRGRQLVLRSYNWDRIAARTIELYSSILSGK
jgi:glycosyltransferase involved in cell wall biosynthesis